MIVAWRMVYITLADCVGWNAWVVVVAKRNPSQCFFFSQRFVLRVNNVVCSDVRTCVVIAFWDNSAL